MPTIDLTKGKNESESYVQEEQTQKMQTAINIFFNHLVVKSDQFNKEKAFDELQKYIMLYDRILYSPISNIIYSTYENSQEEELLGSLMTNLDALVLYALDTDIIRDRKENQNEKIVEDTKKAVLKIWDHVNLANQQYKELKQTDDEYNEKFNQRISDYKEEMTKEMNAQLLTMVSIFTALAFLIFGGISSLDNIFSIKGIPLMKVLAIGLIWGLCVFNLVFLILFCVGKMTRLNFKSTDDPNASIFQKYPVVWWSDLILLSLLVVCLWLYFMQRHKIHIWFVNICVAHAQITTVIGCVLIGIGIGVAVRKLAIATDVIQIKAKPVKEEKSYTGQEKT